MRIKFIGTRQDLHDMGVCSDSTFDRLLSTETFEVQNTHVTREGRVLYYLLFPESPNHMIWVYKEFAEEVADGVA